jgi:peptidoglycan/LPS O-acetylase OafA/YrhL
MNPKALALDQYARDRRRLNTRLGLLMVALIPLPAILLHTRFEPLEMLALIVVVALSVGVIYPVWWRSKHHPYREDGREKRARRIAVVCRTVAFASLVGVMVSWVVGSNVGSWIALAFFATGTSAFILGFEVEERWKRALQRQNAKLRPTRNLSRADVGGRRPR